ncbi:[citrate (pro-3S)-lyase] ligase [Volucribacter amazonae]|uniref:[Citrate [pro-3S]-lyase] ligase n=1 Tax=Volucribacter amazonae TaxID=256731 RepID=A0A9X4PFH8_9PAST|nr:[citrate (pro-3S)-lyase] ligase [Volucribacter amazonae]MDG6896314.1 [citrate (pro-3S)-lyase] ligase [Volucribacter amazonae]
MFEHNYYWQTVAISDTSKIEQIKVFLQQNQLDLDSQIEYFIVFYRTEDHQIIACGGIAPNIIKCVAVSPDYRGQGISLQLATELINFATELGYFRLFLYTKPENEALFARCGFHTISTAYPHMVLMENSAVRLKKYCEKLAQYRQPGEKIGSIVMNANPFTLGHRYLIEQALKQCDYLHLFLVEEDASKYSYTERFTLVKQGIADLVDKVSLYPSSSYIISRATFPSYFLKDKGLIDDCFMEIDLKLFRCHIAPALGITHRFVGTEPNCPVTSLYNQNMSYWLQQADMKAPSIKVVEIQRKTYQGEPISASKVRLLVQQKNWSALTHYVPTSTLALLEANNGIKPNH